MSEMHEVSLSAQNSTLESTMQNVSSMGGMSGNKVDLNGLAAVAH